MFGFVNSVASRWNDRHLGWTLAENMNNWKHHQRNKVTILWYSRVDSKFSYHKISTKHIFRLILSNSYPGPTISTDDIQSNDCSFPKNNIANREKCAQLALHGSISNTSHTILASGYSITFSHLPRVRTLATFDGNVVQISRHFRPFE